LNNMQKLPIYQLLKIGSVSILLAILIAFASSTNVFAQDEQANIVDHVTKLYNEGKFEEAELSALRGLTESANLTDVAKSDLHRILGFIYVVLAERNKAKQQFILWLELDSSAKLDPLYISPKIIDIFNEAKGDFENRGKWKEPLNYSHLNLQMKAVKRSAFFPGLGQIYQGKNVKGYSLFTAEIVLLGTLAYTHLNYERAKDDYLAETNASNMQSLYDEYNNFYRARNASLGLAVAVYLYSLIDALYLTPDLTEDQPTLTLSVNPDQFARLTLNFNIR